MKQRNSRQEKGITLIALVITIIIMLILVAVTVSIAVNGGLFNYAKSASSGYDISKVQEELQVGIYGLQMEYYQSGEAGTLRDFIFNDAEGKGQELLTTELGAINISFDAENNQITYKGLIFSVSEKGGVVFVGESGENNTQTGEEDTPYNPAEYGLFDANGVQLASWETLTTTYNLDIEKDYTNDYDNPNSNLYTNNGTDGNSMTYVLDKFPNAVSVKIPASYTQVANDVEYSLGEKLASMNDDTIISDIDSKMRIASTKNITKIGDLAFCNCDGLTEITIPNGVTSIGSDAFGSCYSLSSITIPDSVTSIGRYAFSHCDSLTIISIPENVTIIEDGLFCECDGLTEITIPNGVTSIGSQAFMECGGLTFLTIPDSVTIIGEDAFGGCSNLQISFGMSSSLTSIGSQAFIYCYRLTGIRIPDGVTNIGEGAFCGCTGLTSITIPESVTSIASDAFLGCSNLRYVNFENTDMEETYSSCFIETPWYDEYQASQNAGSE